MSEVWVGSYIHWNAIIMHYRKNKEYVWLRAGWRFKTALRRHKCSHLGKSRPHDILHATQATPTPPRPLFTTRPHLHMAVFMTNTFSASYLKLWHNIPFHMPKSYSFVPKNTGPKERVKQVNYFFLLLIGFILHLGQPPPHLVCSLRKDKGLDLHVTCRSSVRLPEIDSITSVLCRQGSQSESIYNLWLVQHDGMSACLHCWRQASHSSSRIKKINIHPVF